MSCGRDTSSENSGRSSWIWSTWAKAPHLENSEVLVVSACLPVVNPELFKRLAEGRNVLFACPERESAAYYGKLASMIRSTKPRRLIVVTIDGSPHCFTLQASVNEAEYILGKKLEKEHYVVVDGVELKKISPDAVRLARYLSIVNGIIEKNPEVLEELAMHSKEYQLSRSLKNK
ncbi:MAG: 4Fe-4S ferredoxin [Desulfurococcaceae archaeon]